MNAFCMTVNSSLHLWPYSQPTYIRLISYVRASSLKLADKATCHTHQPMMGGFTALALPDPEDYDPLALLYTLQVPVTVRLRSIVKCLRQSNSCS